jgi:putative ABC transport system substrate-binding protein
VAVIAAIATPTALAAKAATSTIPVVFLIGGDPVQQGLVASFNRPGGNVTGATMLTLSLDAKRLGLLREVLPQASTITFLSNPNFPDAKARNLRLQEVAHAIGLELVVLGATTEAEINKVLSDFDRQRPGALLVGGDPVFTDHRDQIVALVALVAREAIPAMYEWREFAAAGGLMSYGTQLRDIYRPVGLYAGRIVKGEKPADMPVVQPTKFEFVINLKTAKTLGLTIPPGVLAIADEVIE